MITIFSPPMSARWAGPDTVLPPDAGPAAASDEEAAAGGSCPGSSGSPAESGAAAARPGHGAAEGKRINESFVVGLQ